MTVKKTKKKKVASTKAKKTSKALKTKVRKAAKTKVKKPVKAKKSVVKKAAAKSEGKQVGKVVHYYTNIGVAVVELSDALKAGDEIKVKGATSDFTQKVASMQIEHDKVAEAKKGQSIGLKVKKHARQNDVVYKL